MLSPIRFGVSLNSFAHAVLFSLVSLSPGVIFSRDARAQEGTRLADAVAAALRANPDIALARLRADSANAESRIARALPGLFVASVPQVPYQYSISTPLDIGPARLFRTRSAAQGVRAARADQDDAKRQIAFAVRQGFYDVLLGAELREIARERRDILGRLLAADSVRLRTGDVAARDVTKTEVELARADADVARAGAQLHAARLTLQLLMGSEHPDTAFALSGRLEFQPMTFSADSLMALALVNRPDLRAAHERVVQSDASLSQANWAVLPVPVASLVYQDGVPFSSGSQFAVGLGVQLPVFSWYGGERDRSRAGVRAAQVAEQRLRVQIAAELQTALDAWRSARDLAARYEGGLLAKSAAALETARYANRTGAASLLELIEAIRTWSDVQSDHATALHDYWVGVFALDRASGAELTP